MRQPFDLTDAGEHGQHRFDHHPLVPFTTAANLQVGRICSPAPKMTIGQHDHPYLFTLCILPDQPSKGAVMDVCDTRTPINHKAPLVEHKAELGSYDPAMVREAFSSDLP